MFKIFRIFILLLILAAVALGTWRAKTRSVEWKYTLPVNVYLINGDGSDVAAEYMRGLKLSDFKPLEAFMQEEAARYGHASRASIEVRLGGILATQPPAPPQDGSVLKVIFWSLKMRWWAFRHAEIKGAGQQVKLFLLYFDPALSSRLAHSTGLQKGLIGRVNVFASRDMASQNNVVIAHEFLHTLGATDKYDLATNQPIFPDGYAIPGQLPLLPQRFAEIMAGRMPLSENKAAIPEGLHEAVIGEKTAAEINWH
ncbi:MAG: hypothetical protein B7Y56_06745 [Gallionellales bacterium 35-53-114]|jgi:hypothetical protein|nr:MAG: hypothetical protein B7Y56_06745 [Gallionellales bacterium 35-53-114]OYZ63891.1 MAG: hypothetical protein B7Y04_07840 [Gallionellales bacterium 24-53-125]OZB09278.1 MAG: hypothetical protein B7X61_06370 [Gallionellales bacterium 39-52-133]HQS59110.1 hypothetical protein [Gallionellaceae bacterium]HQS75846.1 hypothetical protein [Gallionellaceae bacterium]